MVFPSEFVQKSNHRNSLMMVNRELNFACGSEYVNTDGCEAVVFTHICSGGILVVLSSFVQKTTIGTLLFL